MKPSRTAATGVSPSFRIVPKRDFGRHSFLVDGRWVSSGFVVTFASGSYRGCNAMPGGTWSPDIPGALQMIAVARKVGFRADGEVADSDRFWKLLHRVCGATQRSRDSDKRIRSAVERAQSRWS